MPRSSWRFARSISDIAEIKQETQAGDSDQSAKTTGLIDTSSSEVVLYYDHIYPMAVSLNYVKQRISNFFVRDLSEEQLRTRVLEASQPLPPNAQITEVIPTRRDGGAFVKFKMEAGLSALDFADHIRINAQRQEEQTRKNVFKYIQSLFWNPIPKVYPVKGRPWIEDLRRFPTKRLKVIFEGPPLTEEEIYLLFRRYGFISDIVPGKENAMVVFTSVRLAVCAKNCVTGIALNKGVSTLHLQFVPDDRANYLVDLIVNHQRVSIPLILALLATAAVLIFDPIRQWFVETKISHRYLLDHYKNNSGVRFIMKIYFKLHGWMTSSYDFLGSQLSRSDEKKLMSEKHAPGHFSVWEERTELARQLKLWILENINTFIVVKGPKGLGKEDFVMLHILEPDDDLSKNVLLINCDLLSKCRTELKLIKETADQLGYFPVFTWTNSISQFADLALQGLTGLKSGLSELVETQIKNMFNLTSQAIRNITLGSYRKYVSSIEKQNLKLKQGEEPIEIIKEDTFLQQNPQAKPIIVITKYASKMESNNNDFIYKVLSDWASGLIQNNLAHVIFITSDVGSIAQLNDSLPNLVFKTISLADAEAQSAKQYVLDQIKTDDPHSIAKCIGPIGGRMLDLQAFVRRINSGETPKAAVSEMVTQSAEQVTTFFLNNPVVEGAKSWEAAQVWYIIKHLANRDHVSYSDLLLCPLFPTQSEAISVLASLEKHDLVVLKRDKGVLESIVSGRPLYKAAFKDLVDDPRVYNLYQRDYLKASVAAEALKIAKFEAELVNIRANKKDVYGRIQYLSEKIESGNDKIVKMEQEMAALSTPAKSTSLVWKAIF